MEAQTEIIVAKEGWVFVGDVAREGDFVVIRRAHNVALWGTTKGLGQLIDGPTSSTVLDRCGAGVVRLHVYNLMHNIPVDAFSWNDRLGAAPRELPDDSIGLVLCEQRWVYLGRVAREGDYFAIRNAVNVRSWPISDYSMTSLWDLCRGKKASKVALDPVDMVRVGVLGTVAQIGCSPDASVVLPSEPREARRAP